MMRLNRKELAGVLTALCTILVQVLQVANLGTSAFLLLLQEYIESQNALQDALVERNRALRRYIRHQQRFGLR